jgi:hypothetical protein
MCSLQCLQQNMVFLAKTKPSCGSIQKMHQHVVLPAIFSHWRKETTSGTLATIWTWSRRICLYRNYAPPFTSRGHSWEEIGRASGGDKSISTGRFKKAFQNSTQSAWILCSGSKNGSHKCSQNRVGAWVSSKNEPALLCRPLW